MNISIVIPVYRCKPFLSELTQRIHDSLNPQRVSYELIYVNDGCPDNSWEEITRLCSEYKSVKGIKLSKNFGQHKAIHAGLTRVSGDWVVVMDGDLQDRPEEIIQLYDKALQGYDIVFAERQLRQDSFFKRSSSKLFYKFLSYLTDSDYNPAIANFGIFSRKVIKNVNSFKERSRLFPLLVKSVGFQWTSVAVTHSARAEGESSYTFKKLVNLALDTIIAYSNKPLRLSIKLGFFVSLSSFVYSLWLFLRYFYYDVHVAGWTSVMVSLFFLSGLILSMLGIVGLYIGKIYEEVKGRPLFIVDEILNIE